MSEVFVGIGVEVDLKSGFARDEIEESPWAVVASGESLGDSGNDSGNNNGSDKAGSSDADALFAPQ